MNKFENSKKYAKITELLNSKNQKVHNNLIEFYLSNNDIKNAELSIKICINDITALNENEISYVFLASIQIFKLKYKEKKIIDTLKQYKDFVEENQLSKLVYYKCFNAISGLIDFKINIIKNLKIGLSLAFEKKDEKLILDFYHGLTIYYLVKRDKVLFFKYAQLSIQQCEKVISPRIKNYTLQLMGIYNSDFGRNLIGLKQVIRACNNNLILNQIPIGLLFEIMNIYFNIGNLKLYEFIINNYLKTASLNVILKLKLQLTTTVNYIFLNEINNAKLGIKKGLKLIKGYNELNEERLYKLIRFSFVDYSTIKLLEDEYEIYLKNNKNKFTHFQFHKIQFIRTESYLKYDLKYFEKIILNYHQSGHKIGKYFYKYLLIVWKVKSNKLKVGITLIKDLENSFNGEYLWLYFRLYFELLNTKHLPKNNKLHFIELYNLIGYIMFQSENYLKKIPQYKIKPIHRFKRFLLNWAVAIQSKTPFQETELDLFTSNLELKENLIFLLKQWDVNVEYTIQEIKEKELIYIQTFGTLKMIYKNKNLIGGKFLPKIQAKLLAYILVQHYFNNGPVQIDKLIDDNHNPKKEIEKTNRTIKQYLSKIKKFFTNMNIDIFIIDSGKIYLKPKIEFDMDIRKFDIMKKTVDQNLIESNWNKALPQLDLCFHLIKGEFFNGRDNEWLDPIRSFYYQQYMEIIHSYIAVYEEMEMDTEIIEMLETALRIFPESPEIEELIISFSPTL